MRFHFMLSIAVISSLAFLPGKSYASCADFLDDIGQSFGVSYKKDPDTGKIKAFLMVGEASFIAPKSSLVRKAKKKAFMNAKAEFSRFMKEDFSAADMTTDLTNQIEQTDNEGNTAGLVEEMSSMVETMASSTSSVLSGIVVLGECVDKEQKLVMVQAGWKPELSSAAATAKKTMKAPSKSGASSKTKVSNKADTSSSSQPSSTSASATKSTSKKKAGITIISVEAEGEGGNLKQATNEAIRSAIAQVLGEKFASSQLNTDFTATAEVSSSSGASAGVAVETSTQLEVQSSEVSGIISGYSYISKNELSNGIKVTLLVEIPKYESSLDKSKNTLIVFEPQINKFEGISRSDAAEITATIQNNLENILNETNKLEVLDREFLKKRSIELATVSSGNNSMAELARVGNLAGADFMLVLEFETLSMSEEEKKVGGNTIKRQVFNGAANYKLIEVATSNIVSSGSVPIRKMKFRSEAGLSGLSSKVTQKVTKKIVRKLKATISEEALMVSQDDSQNVKDATKRAEDSMKKLKEKSKNDW